MTSYLRSSIIQWLEDIIERARGNMSKIRPTYTLIAERITNLGEVFFKYVSAFSNRLTMILDKMQIRLIEPMIMASLWFGLISLIIVLIIILGGE